MDDKKLQAPPLSLLDRYRGRDFHPLYTTTVTVSGGETGHGRGLGSTLNIPVKANTAATEQKRSFDAAIEEISTKIKPDIIFISAGFDAHLTDPLGQLRLEDTDYVSMTSTVKQWADDVCSGRIVSCLEGGYNLETLGPTVAAHVAELAR